MSLKCGVLGRSARCLALLAFAAATEVLAQTSTAAVYGVVRDVDRRPLQGIAVMSGGRGVLTDSAGGYSLDSLRTGSVRITIRFIGKERVDTTLALRAGTRTRWDVTMRVDTSFAESHRQAAAAESARVKAGGVDSIGHGFIKPASVPALPDGGFGRRLFADAATRRGIDSNTVLSPVSAAIALSIVRLGARGATAVALDRLFGVAPDAPNLFEVRGPDVIAAMNGRTDVVLQVTNAIWVDTSAALMPPFQSAVARWRASVTSLPLASPATPRHINRWADSVSHGKIPNLLSGNLPDTTRLFIANAVYFNGKWLDPFKKSATKPGPFTLAAGQRLMVPRMERTARMGYRRLASAQVVRIPYRTGKVAMYVVLPDSGMSFDAALRVLDDTTWTRPGSTFARVDVHLVLPRFRSEVEVNLVPAIRAMGAGIALDCSRADFTGMARLNNPGDRGLCIGRAFQRVYIDVDEEGTEAVAITGIGMVTTTSAPPPPIDFIVDRPFLFVLRDEVTGTDLFVGRIARP